MHDLLPGSEVVLIGVSIEDTAANAPAHVAACDVAYLSPFLPVNDPAGRFSGSGACTIPTIIFLNLENRVARQLLGSTDTGEIVALADSIENGASY